VPAQGYGALDFSLTNERERERERREFKEKLGEKRGVKFRTLSQQRSVYEFFSCHPKLGLLLVLMRRIFFQNFYHF